MRIFFFLAALLFAQPLFSCTTFFINHNGQMVFGRNYDWVTGTGLIHTNLRGVLKKPYSADSSTFSWSAKYGSITFNQYGKEYPTGGMNEKGLVVELMWLDGTLYPSNDSRAEIGVLQWIQYQLDNAATIDEVIASDKIIRITNKNGAPLHYLVADKKGNAATIEFAEGKMLVHRGNQLPFAVLTNSFYTQSLKSREQVSNDNSLQRFKKACTLVEDFKNKKSGNAVDHAFHMLDAVSQGDFTKWSIAYDLTNMKITFKTAANKNLKAFSFSDFDFGCDKNALVHDINTSSLKASAFLPFSSSKNLSFVKNAVEESSSEITISDVTVQRMTYFATSFSCKNQ